MYYVLTKKKDESLYIRDSLDEKIDVLADFEDSKDYEIYKIFVTEESCTEYLRQYKGEAIDLTPELTFYSKLGFDVILPF